MRTQSALARDARKDRHSKKRGPRKLATTAPEPAFEPSPLERLERRLHSYPLTRREREIVRLLSQGRSNKEIAERCFISELTVKDHLKHVYGKIGVATRTAAIAELLGTNGHS